MSNAITNYFAGVRKRWNKLQAKQDEARARDRAAGLGPTLPAVGAVVGTVAAAAAKNFFNDFQNPVNNVSDFEDFPVHPSHVVHFIGEHEKYILRTHGVAGACWLNEKWEADNYGFDNE